MTDIELGESAINEIRAKFKKTPLSIKDISSHYIFLLIFACMFIYGLISCIQTVDNDVYWMVTVGNYILKYGKVPDTTFWNIREYPTIIQQPLCCIVNALLYDIGKNTACAVFGAVTYTGTVASIWHFIRKYVDRTNINAALLTVAIFCFPLSMQTNTRTHLVTITLIFMMMSSLEKYRRSRKNSRELFRFFSFALFSGLFMNIWQSSFVIFFILLIGTYAVPCMKIEKGWFSSYIKELAKRWPYFAAIMVFIAGGCIIPGGCQREIYLVLSSDGVKATNNYIGELQQFTIYPYGVFLFAAAVYMAVWFYKRRGKITSESHIFWLAFGLSFLSTLHGRNFWLPIIPLVYMLPESFRQTHDDNADKLTYRIFYGLFTLIGISFEVLALTQNLINISEDECLKQNEFVEYLNENSDENTTLFTSFNMGGMYEMCGYRTYIDARPELYTVAINKNEDILGEYLDIISSHDSDEIKEFIEKYDFTDMITSKNYGIYMYLDSESSGYKKVKETENYALFERRENTECSQ